MYDNELILQDAALKAASGYGTVGGVAQVRELGEGWVKGRLVIRADFVAFDPFNPDKLYQLILEGGLNAAFTGNTAELCRVELGYATQCIGFNFNRFAGHYIAYFSNRLGDRNSVVYPHVRMHHILTSAGGVSINYRAVISPLP